MKYTKGEWQHWQGSKRDPIEILSGGIYDGENDAVFFERQICIISQEYDEVETDYDEQLANAKLISKAPEMYEALNRIYKILHPNIQVDENETLNKCILEIESLLKEIES